MAKTQGDGLCGSVQPVLNVLLLEVHGSVTVLCSVNPTGPRAEPSHLVGWLAGWLIIAGGVYQLWWPVMCAYYGSIYGLVCLCGYGYSVVGS